MKPPLRLPFQSPLQIYSSIQLLYDRRIRRSLAILAQTLRKLAQPYNSFSSKLLKEVLVYQSFYITQNISPIIIQGISASSLEAFYYAKQVQTQTLPNLSVSYSPLSKFMENREEFLLARAPSVPLARTINRSVRSTHQTLLSSHSPSTDLYESLSPQFPGGASHPIIQTTRMEMSAAFRQEQIEVAENSPLKWAKGFIWELSDDHHIPDECNTLAEANPYLLGKGVYPLKKLPLRPHYNCLCLVRYLINSYPD